MALAIFLSRILGFVRDAAISYRFGLSLERDAYVAAFTLPDILYFLIAGGALSSAIIPIFTRYVEEGKPDEAWRVFSSIVCVLGAIVTAFVIAAWIFADPIVSIIFKDLDPSIQPLTANLARVLLPSQIAFFIGGLIFGTMYAQRHFVIPAMAPNVYNVGIICGAMFFAPLISPAIFGPAWGALIGAVVGNLVIPIFALKKFGAKFELRFDFNHPGVRRILRLMVPVIFGLGLPGIYAIFLRWFGSHYPQHAISALDIGNKIMQAPLGIFGQSLAIAVYPVLSSFHSQSKSAQFLSTVGKTTRTALFVGLILSALIVALSTDIVRVQNQYGKFSSADTAFVAKCAAMYGIGVFAWCAHPILTRAFFAMEDAWTPVILGTITTFLFVAGCGVVQRLDLGYEWLAFWLSICAIILVILLFISLRSRLGRIEGSETLRLILAALPLAVGIAALIRLAGAAVPVPAAKHSLAFSVVRLLLLGGSGFLAFVFVGTRLGIKEAQYVWKALARRLMGKEQGSQPPGGSR